MVAVIPEPIEEYEPDLFGRRDQTQSQLRSSGGVSECLISTGSRPVRPRKRRAVDP